MNKRCCGSSVPFSMRGWGAAAIAVSVSVATASLMGCQPQAGANRTPSAEATHSPAIPTTTPGDHGPPPRMPVN